MRQEKVTCGLRRAGRSLKRQKAGGVGSALSNVLKKRNSLSRTAPRLLCTLEPGLDTKLKFALEPLLAQSGFQQWYDAFRAVARLPSGIPREWRRRVWLTLADHYLHSISIDWEKTHRFVFSDSCNPDDDSVGLQIVKDLHRTGCRSYCGREAEDGRGVLKRVLLAYARWNQSVGYCQGFHILAAFILEVVEGDEGDALKIMILLIDKVLPGNYFVDNLRGLSVDMAVFRELLRIRLPELSDHLEALQRGANAETGGGYEPPLTNVFAMQWFLTLFATCLPTHTVLKIWDSVFFEGSEIILRVALAIWEKLGEQTEWCRSADEFYSTMGRLTQEMLEGNLIDGPELIQTVYSMAPFPFPQLVELRETFTYNITPFPAPVKSASFSGHPSRMPDSDEETDLDDEAGAVGCLGPISGLLAPELQRDHKHIRGQGEEQNAGSITHLSPGAVHSSHGEHQALFSSMMMERMTTDISFLQRQYCSMKRRQLQQKHRVYITADKGPVSSLLLSPINHPLVVNHLLIGKRLKTVNNSASVNHLRASKSLILSSEKNRERLDSTCCTQVSEKRRNIARTKCHLGCGGTNGVVQGPRELSKDEACTVPGTEDLVQDLVRNEDDSGRMAVKDDGLSSEPALQGENTLTVVQSKFEALELNSIKDTKEKLQMTSFIQSSSERSQKGHVFTPFPNVKPLRQSATARNLGLYGPNCRTPAVNFPHIRKKSLDMTANHATGSKRR